MENAELTITHFLVLELARLCYVFAMFCLHFKCFAIKIHTALKQIHTKFKLKFTIVR